MPDIADDTRRGQNGTMRAAGDEGARRAARSRLPGPLRHLAAAELLRAARAVRHVEGLPSRLRILGLGLRSAFRSELSRPSPDSAVAVRVRRYGQRVWLRPRSRDLHAFAVLHERHHLPPELGKPVEHIAVFGSFIGLLALDLAVRFPAAKVLAVEVDPGNAEMTRRNLAPLGERCSVVEAAIWHEDTRLEFGFTSESWGMDVRENHPEAAATVRAVGARRLLDAFTGGRPVDFVLVHIENSWYELFRHGDWLATVLSVRAEVPDHFDEAVPLLEAAGFTASLQRFSWGGFLSGRHPGAGSATTATG